MAILKTESAPKLKKGTYVYWPHVGDLCKPLYLDIKETASAFTLSWSSRNKEMYKGLDQYYKGLDTGDWSDLIWRTAPTVWTGLLACAKNNKVTIRKAGSQHAIYLDDADANGEVTTCWVNPYRNGQSYRFDLITD